MRCKILAVGKLKERYWQEGIAEYRKRLQPVFPVEIWEAPDQPIPERASAAQVAQAVAKEGQAILNQIDGDTLLVALAINGKQLSSEQFAAQLADWSFGGGNQLAFAIGGSCGLSPEVLDRANLRLSFGKMTYPHQLMRLVLMEQIYRAVKINRGEPYHK